MLRLERHARILELVQERGFVATSELTERFNVSIITVRRDLRTLVSQHLVDIQHGGAAAVDYFHKEIEPLYDTKAFINAAKKDGIALLAADLIKDNDTIVLDSGTTTYRIANAIRQRKPKRLRVFTGDIMIGRLLCPVQGLEVVVIGGLLRNSYYNTYGSLAEMCLRTLRANKLFLGADAATVKGGISNLQLEEVPIKQRMIEISDEVFVVADSTKFNTNAPYRVCDWDAVSTLITDTEIDRNSHKEIQASGVRVLTAEFEETESRHRRQRIESGRPV